MLLRILIALTALLSLITPSLMMHALDTRANSVGANMPQFFRHPHNQSSFDYSDASCCSSISCLRGPRGSTGPQGDPGISRSIIDGIYAHAFYQQEAGANSTTFNPGDPIIFNQITQARGVDTSQLTTNGSFIIQSAGDYLVSYYFYGDNNSGNTNLVPVYISLLLNGTIVTQSIVGIAAKASQGPLLPMSGKLILHFNTGDVIQLEAIGANSISSASSPESDSIKIASLTIRKLSQD